MRDLCFIDVHCHLDLCSDIEKCILNARENNVGLIITQGVNRESNRKALELSNKYKEVKAALGIYPIDALKMSDQEIDKEINFIRKNNEKISAIGEVGMDFKESEKEEERERQKEIFIKFVSLASELNKPIIVHSRKAEKECIEILEKMNAQKVIMHCFSGRFSLIERIANNKWFLSIPTSIKNSEHFQNIAKNIKIENLLCETDSPYLHPDKKWPNEPAFVIESYKKIAEIKKITLKETEEKISENYLKLFDKL